MKRKSYYLRKEWRKLICLYRLRTTWPLNRLFLFFSTIDSMILAPVIVVGAIGWVRYFFHIWPKMWCQMNWSLSLNAQLNLYCLYGSTMCSVAHSLYSKCFDVNYATLNNLRHVWGIKQEFWIHSHWSTGGSERFGLLLLCCFRLTPNSCWRMGSAKNWWCRWPMLCTKGSCSTQSLRYVHTLQVGVNK